MVCQTGHGASLSDLGVGVGRGNMLLIFFFNFILFLNFT